MKSITVMITGAGAPGAPGIIKSLRLNGERNIRIVGVDAELKTAIGIGLADVCYEIPKASSPDFINIILEICKKENVEVLIPLVTMELFVFSQNLKLFNDIGVKVLVSEYRQLNVANNKYHLMQFCQKNGIPAPEHYLIKTLDEFIEKAKKLGYPQNQICFKPPVSNGLRGFRIVNDSSDKMNNLINEKPNNVYIGFDEFIEIANSSDYFPELLLMEYLPGKEYSVDALGDGNKCYAVIPRTRDKIKMGISFAGTVVKDSEIIDYSQKIIEELHLTGNIGFQFKRDKNGIPKIIESNPRVQGTIVLCTAANYNMVYNSIKLALGEKLEEPNIKWNTKMIRYWDEIYVDETGKSFKI